jgi:imidazolonepropionase-like amidohydrolase
MTVIISGNRIAAIGKTGTIKIPSPAQVVEARGKFLIPGLWDMHVHTLFTSYPQKFFPLLIANGVVGVRDMGSPFGLAEIRQLKRDILEGRTLGPHIVAAGPIVDGPNPIWPFSLVVKDEIEAQRAVDRLKQEGADFVKVYNLLPRDAYFAIAEESKRQDIPFAGHTPVSVSVNEASDAGQKSVEHLSGVLLACSNRQVELANQRREALTKLDGRAAFTEVIRNQGRILLDTYDKRKAAALFIKFAKNKTWQVPTLTVLRAFAFIDDSHFTNDSRMKYVSQFTRRTWDPMNDFRLKQRSADDITVTRLTYLKQTEIVREMHGAGVRFLAGTDLSNPYIFAGFSLHDELALLVEAGLTPMEALQSATRNPADYLGLLQDQGTVETGKIADLVLLEADPLKNIANSGRIAGVVLGGRFLSKPDLQKLLDDSETTARKLDKP